VLLNELLTETVAEKEILFNELLKGKPGIENVRSAGLLIAIELKNEQVVQETLQQLLAKGIFSDWFLFAPNCIRIATPLTISFAEITRACAEIVAALASDF
jgi:acetylornithine/succinyldiaminopimelate/putrescine aminotransferase